MQFTSYNSLPQIVRNVIEGQDYVGYIRVYYRNGYGSRMFFKDAANGSLKDIRIAEERGKKRFTEEMREAVKTVCEILFEEKSPNGRYDLYDFCEKNGFDKTEDGYRGYCYLAHTAFEIVVSKTDDYFCRLYFYDRNNHRKI